MMNKVRKEYHIVYLGNLGSGFKIGGIIVWNENGFNSDSIEELQELIAKDLKDKKQAELKASDIVILNIICLTDL